MGGGSSPLARGLQLGLQLPGRGGGIIPARAGFTFRKPSFTHLRRDHPRSRGVYFCFDAEVLGAEGSSPLARGLLIAIYVHNQDERIIPARAGFT